MHTRPDLTARTCSNLVSVVIPCRNDRETAKAVLAHIPEVGAGTEIVFVDGGSTDGTDAEIEKLIAANPGRAIRLLYQGKGRGKDDAVQKGLAASRGRIQVVLCLDNGTRAPHRELQAILNALSTVRGS